MKRIILGMFVVLAVVLLSSCITRLGAFTVISTKSIDWSRAGEFTRSKEDVKGQDRYSIIIVIPTKGNVTIEEAVDNALEKVPGAIALIDAVLYADQWYIPYIYGEGAYVVEAKALIDPKLAMGKELQDGAIALLSKDGLDYTAQNLTAEQYNAIRKRLDSAKI